MTSNRQISKSLIRKNFSNLESPKKPEWIKVTSFSKNLNLTASIVNDQRLTTVCEEALCPNISECWNKKHATFMILGEVCTRSCSFCNIQTGKPTDVDPFEPLRVAKAVRSLNLKHVVITSVDRDDLKDIGTFIWSETIKAIRRLNPKTTLETLIPDFQGSESHIDKIVEVKPEVVSHNMETVRRLTREVRIQAKYDRSLKVLNYLKMKGIRRTKSGIMLGLGEKENEVFQTLIDLKENNVDIVTIGQYLQPSKKHLPVKDFIYPEQFKIYESYAKNLGFRHVESGALVRSSYKAQKHIN